MSDNIINEKSLTVGEVNLLEELEGVVKDNFLAFVKVGEALAEIRNKRLYRNQENRTWEGYCRELWDMSKAYADRLVASGKVIANLKTAPIGGVSQDHPGFILPLNESQARPLAMLEPKEQALVWGDVLEYRLAQEKDGVFPKVSTTTVKKAVKEYLGEKLGGKSEQPSKKATPNRKNFSSENFDKAHAAFIEQVKIEHAKSWRDTSRSVVFQSLSDLLDLVAIAGPKEIKKKGCSMELANREKLEKGGFRVFRMLPAELAIEESISGKWQVITSHDSASKMSEVFKELMTDPRNLRG